MNQIMMVILALACTHRALCMAIRINSRRLDRRRNDLMLAGKWEVRP